MVISEPATLAAHNANPNDSVTWDRWAAASQLRRMTHPLIRGTRSLGGGLIPLRNGAHLYR